MKEAYIPKTKTIDPNFCRWAFGCEYNDRIWQDAIQLMKAWNDRHGNELKLFENGDIFQDLCRMGGLWAENGYPDGVK